MKSFLRENPTIAFGLGLPLLLVAVFLLVSGIPALFVAPPQYDVLYATNFFGYAPGVQISVVNKKVQVAYQGNSLGYQQQPRFWRYNPKTGAVREIAITLPANLTPPAPAQMINPEANSKVTAIEVPEVADLTVDSSSIAPDGYEFRAGGNGNPGEFFGGLFWGSRYRNEAVLAKNGRSVHLPTPGGAEYYYFPTRFIGWVVAP
jgi:hypothetical protein